MLGDRKAAAGRGADAERAAGPTGLGGRVGQGPAGIPLRRGRRLHAVRPHCRQHILGAGRARPHRPRATTPSRSRALLDSSMYI